ncbi:hypothetical protein P7H16_21640 [Paenibacillus larvae]|nr:hypothetical protein [Paenibacillus larvae]MDT2248994.1 hypothetical protein [Paenibacillus larvae]
MGNVRKIHRRKDARYAEKNILDFIDSYFAYYPYWSRHLLVRETPKELDLRYQDIFLKSKIIDMVKDLNTELVLSSEINNWQGDCKTSECKT